MSKISTDEVLANLEMFGGFSRVDLDNWIREIKRDAWEEGFNAGEQDVIEHEAKKWYNDCIPDATNPYRKETW